MALAIYTYKRMTISEKKILIFRILFILVKQVEGKEKSFDSTTEMRKVKKHHRRRRRRRSSVISNENSDVRTIHMPQKRMRPATDDLLIDLVLEILHRLDLKSATSCKSVSKEWCFVITNPFFTRCFVYHW